MSSWRQVIAITSTTGAILLSRLAPEYRVHDSTFQTGAVLWLAQAILCMTYTILLYPIFFSPLLKLPGPSGNSLFMGQFFKITKEPSGVPMQEWTENIKNDGLIHYRTIFNTPRVLLTSPKALAEVLTVKSYDFVKPSQIREGLGRILGVGVLLAEGDEHKRQRKHLTPAFAFRHVKDLYPVFWAKSVEMVKTMKHAITTPSEGEKPSNVIEVGEWASRAALDIIGVAGMGRDFNAIEDPSNELYQTYRRIFRPTTAARVLGLAGLFLPAWLVRNLPIKRNDDMQQASSTVKRVAYDLIQSKKAKMEKGEAADVDILSVALESGGFTDDDLVNQLMTFLAAGHETTASTMNWAIMQMCQNPEMQVRLRKDLREAGITSPFASEGGAKQVTAADLDKVPYLAAVCNEVLRVNPPVAMTLRSAACDTSILGQYIPKGTTIIMCPLATNHNKELWGSDAMEFKPDRWMGAGKANSGGASSNYAFMTFIHGPRGCIGSAFAKAEFMCLLAAWIAGFETELEDPTRKIEVAGGVTSRPKGGLKVKLTPILS